MERELKFLLEHAHAPRFRAATTWRSLSLRSTFLMSTWTIVAKSWPLAGDYDDADPMANRCGTRSSPNEQRAPQAH